MVVYPGEDVMMHGSMATIYRLSRRYVVLLELLKPLGLFLGTAKRIGVVDRWLLPVMEITPAEVYLWPALQRNVSYSPHLFICV